jgi:hypothetical protein
MKYNWIEGQKLKGYCIEGQKTKKSLAKGIVEPK